MQVTLKRVWVPLRYTAATEHTKILQLFLYFCIYDGTIQCPWAQMCVLPQQFYWILNKIITLRKYYCVFLTVFILRKSPLLIDVMQLRRSCYNHDRFNYHLQIKYSWASSSSLSQVKCIFCYRGRKWWSVISIQHSFQWWDKHKNVWR